MEQLDLGLLRVFDALMECGSVTAAAERLHSSAPVTSRALGRLRRAWGDPLLVRSGRGLVPTTFALDTAPRVRALLEAADGLATRARPDPSTWRRTLAVRVNDALSIVLAPRLARRAAEVAPGVVLRFTPQDSKSSEPLRDGSLDLDIGARAPTPPDVCTEPLLTDHFVAVLRRGCALAAQESLTAEDLVALPHVSASRRGLTHGPVDVALAARGLHRRVATVAPSYPIAALMVLEDDLICLLPSLMTRHLARAGLPLEVFEVPLELPVVQVDVRWHARADADPVSRWLRDLVVEVAAGAAPGS